MIKGIIIIIIVNLYFVFKEALKSKIYKKFKMNNNDREIKKSKIINFNSNKISLIIIESILLIGISYYLQKYLAMDFNPIENGNEIEISLNKSSINIRSYEKTSNIFIEILEYIFNISKSLEIYLGLIGLISAIYIYCIGVADSFKKNILIFLMGEGDILFISVSILFFYFFNIPVILFLALILILFVKLLLVINIIFLVLDQKRFENIFQEKIVKKFKKSENKRALLSIYEEIKFNLYESVLSKNLVRTRELMFYFVSFLKIDKNEINKNEDEDPESEFIYFFYKVYKYLIDSPDMNTLILVSTMSKTLGDYFLEKENYRYAKSCYSLIEYDYEYYIKNYEEDIFLNIGYELFSSLGNSSSDKVYELATFEHALIKVIYNCIRLSDYKNLKEFLVFYDLDLMNNDLRRQIKIYSLVTIIYFLESVKNIDTENLEKRDEILLDIKARLEYEKIDNLEKAYTLGEEKGLYKFLEIDRLEFPRYDFSGMSGGIFYSEQIRETFIKILNHHYGYLSKKFILKNWSKLSDSSNYKELENIKRQLDFYKVEIAIERAKRNYKQILNYEKIKNNVKEINKEEEKTKVFSILEDISINPIQSSIVSKLNTQKGFKKTFQNSQINSDNFVKNISLELNRINESFIMENIIQKRISRDSVQKLEDYIIIIPLALFVELRKRGEVSKIKDKDVYIYKSSKVYFLSKEIEKIILIKLNSIFQVFYNKQKNSMLEYSQLTIRQLKENEIDNINGLSEEEKKIKALGMSEVEIFKEIEIIYNDDFEVLEVENLFDID